jgi:hypothetical protein
MLLAIAALVLVACSSSRSTNTPPGAPATAGTATTPTSAQPNATTPCTIPQNNGGDHDADNNGGPSDGDGCDR